MYNFTLYNKRMRITRGGGKSLRRALARVGLTQVALAQSLGVTQQAVSAWLNGRRRPSAEHRARLDEIVGERTAVAAAAE